MSASPSLYRRHRPRTFADVVGQEHVVRTLSHAVEQDQIHHAYLFVGSRGTGKTSMAKILAACLNCEQGPTVSPCGVCDSCVSIANATSLDVIEMDAASNNSVDDIRELRDKVAYAPVSGRHKVYILDEAHMLSTQAWNAFLKTLEEPPPRTVFVLATTEARKVLPTVVDRCHRFDFGRPSAEQVAEVLRRVSTAESIDIDDGAMALIARNATGSFRDALGTLEQLLTYSGGARIEPADVLAVLGVADLDQLAAAVDAVTAGDPASALRAAAALTAAGRDPAQILRDLEGHVNDLLTVQIMGAVPEQVRVTPDRDAALMAQAQRLSPVEAARLLELVVAALGASNAGAQPRIQLELALVKAAAPEVDPSLSALMTRLQRLERSGAPVASASVASASVVDGAGAPSATSAPAPSATDSADASAGDEDDFWEGFDATPWPEEAEPSAPAVAATSPTPPAAKPAPAPTPAPAVAKTSAAAPATGGADALVADGAAAPPAAGAATSFDLAQFKSVWPAVVDRVRASNAMLAVLLDGAQPNALEGGTLALAWPPANDFYRRKAEREEYRRVAIDAIRDVTGMTLNVNYLLAERQVESAPQATPAGVAAEPVKLSEDEVVQRFIDDFGASEIPDPDEQDS